MGGADQTDVDVFAGDGANSADLAFLNKSQQSSLSGERQFTNFIEKQSAAISGLNQT